VIHLTVEFATALKRIGITTHRPLLAINPRATLRYLLSQRLPLYASVATHTVSTEGKEPAEIAVEVAALLKSPADDRGER
jgi:shikimate kinase